MVLNQFCISTSIDLTTRSNPLSYLMPYKSKEAKNKNQRTWYQNNKPKKAAEVAAYRAKNKEFVAAYRKKYQQENAEKINARNRAARATDPEKHARKRYGSHIRSKYGITLEEFDTLLTNQGNICLICNKEFDNTFIGKPRIDHCHDTGKIRGLIHHKCNVLLGFAEDKVEILLSAIKYLTKN